MDNKHTVKTGDSWGFVAMAKPGKWICRIAPNFVLHPNEGTKIPNAFNRLMQRWLLGFKWEKVE